MKKRLSENFNLGQDLAQYIQGNLYSAKYTSVLKTRRLLSIQLLKISLEICVEGFSKYFLLSLPFIQRT